MNHHTIVLPALGESVDEATIVAVLVEPGERIEIDQPVLEVSTDKVDTEVAAVAAGVVAEVRVRPDDVVAPGDTLIVLAFDQEETGAEGPDATVSSSGEEPAPVADAPEAVQRAAQPPVPASPPTEAGPGAARPRPGASTLVSPAVEDLLARYALDVAGVTGTGKGGRVTPTDLMSRIERDGLQPVRGPESAASDALTRPPDSPVRPAAGVPRSATRTPVTPPASPPPAGRASTTPLPRRRQLIAQRMRDSLATTAQLTSVVEADMTAVMSTCRSSRDDFAARWGTRLTPLALVARATCLALARHRRLNASVDIDGGVVIEHQDVNLGIAVDTTAGLVVPAIKDAGSLTAGALARRIADLATRAREGGLSPDDVSGGTFTITNTGSRGSLLDTPILNPPEVGILAVTRILRRPVVVATPTGESIAIRDIAHLCLSYDHQLIDGADAARFLGDIAETLSTVDWEAELT